MDYSYIVEVFEWRGSVHVTCDRIGRSAGRRYAPRVRLWTESRVLEEPVNDPTGVAILALAVADHSGLLADLSGPEGPPAPPGRGATGGDTPPRATATRRTGALPSGTAAPPRKEPRDVVASDGLTPEGRTPPLF
jgi:hypothetical protein